MVDLKKIGIHSAISSLEVGFRNGKKTGEENVELKTSIKTQKE